MEDNLPRNTTFGGRQPSVEDNLWWKTTFGGKGPSMEDDLWWRTSFGGRQPSVEENLWWILANCLVRFAALNPFSLAWFSLYHWHWVRLINTWSVFHFVWVMFVFVKLNQMYLVLIKVWFSLLARLDLFTECPTEMFG